MDGKTKRPARLGVVLRGDAFTRQQINDLLRRIAAAAEADHVGGSDR